MGASGTILHYAGSSWTDKTLPKADTTPGDVDNDEIVNLADAVLALKISAGTDVSGQILNSDASIGTNNRIGMEDAVFILQVVAGLRQQHMVD